MRAFLGCARAGPSAPACAPAASSRGSRALAPAAIAALCAASAALRDEGVTLLLVAQMAGPALTLADRAYVIETGRIVRTGAAAEIAADDALREAYLGGHA